MKSCLLLAVLVGTSRAFSATRPQLLHLRPSAPSAAASESPNANGNANANANTRSTALHGIKRRGKLTNNVSTDEDGNIKVISNKRKQKLGNAKNGAGRKGGKNRRGRDDDDGAAAVAISPLLTEWANSDDGDLSSTTTKTTSATSKSDAMSASDVFVPFDDDDEQPTNKKAKKGSRKSSKTNKASPSASSLLTEAQSSRMDSLLESIAEQISTTNCDVPDLVSEIAALVDLGASFSKDQLLLPALKSIASRKPRADDEKQPAYRLAWVGSDDAICHVGTSLHKVPLARLQEIYLLLGYNRWELLEVIRILGPFPNVRNTLKGDLSLKKLRSSEREGVRMEVAYNSMIDGTGKEILAGKEDNIKRVGLDVWFANEKAIVCTMVPMNGDGDDDDDMDGGGDPLGGNGSRILYFAAEENLDEELEKLRAA